MITRATQGSCSLEADERSRLAEAADGGPPLRHHFKLHVYMRCTCTYMYVITPVIFAETLLARSGHGRGVLNTFSCALKVSQVLRLL